MKSQSKKFKTFSPNKDTLQTRIERQKIEYLVEKIEQDNAKFSTKLKRFLAKIF